MDVTEKIYQMALHLIKGVGVRLWSALIHKLGSATTLYETSPENLQLLLKRLPPSITQGIRQKNTLKEAEELIYSHTERKIEVISFLEPNYPHKLKQIAHPPTFLYYHGKVPLSQSRMVGIVGTRNATSYGKQVLEDLLPNLVPYQVTIVSGLAYGIDIHAHQLALQYNLPTIGILAGGLDRIYPSVHKKTAENMVANGGLLTEIPLGKSLECFRFPQRNRIIAGITDATVVVEADLKSGALITADFANAYDREVFAVPGNIHERRSSGCNQLIKSQKAHLLTTAIDLAYVMNWEKNQPHNLEVAVDDGGMFMELATEERAIVKILQGAQNEMHIDELSFYTNLPSNELSSLLLGLEFKNVVQSLPGNKLRLTNLNCSKGKLTLV